MQDRVRKMAAKISNGLLTLRFMDKTVLVGNAAVRVTWHTKPNVIFCDSYPNNQRTCRYSYSDIQMRLQFSHINVFWRFAVWGTG